MMRSISARIFAGFVVVIVAFGAVMGTTVYRMHRVRQHLVLSNQTYLQLMLISSELNYTQGRLVNRIAERAAGRSTMEDLRHHIRVARKYRIGNARRGLRLIERAEDMGLPPEDARFLDVTKRALSEAVAAFRSDESLFEELFSADRTSTETMRRIGDNLLRGERRLEKLTAQLRRHLRGRMRSTAAEIVAHQRTALWLGLGLVLATLALSLTVTFRARRLLSPLKTLVASTRRIGAGDYAGRIPVESHDELGLLAEEFNNMAAAVQEREARLIRSERMAAAGRLASHITHEVRNPLNSISLNTEILEEELATLEGDASESRTLCRAIRCEVDRLTGITEEYLRFARLPKPSLQEEDVNEILSSLLGFIAGELAERDVVVETRLAQHLPRVQADENQLRQALLNLVRNAGEAMAGNGGGTLRAETAVRDGLLQVTIADTGPGIAAENLPQVFEPFFSTKRSGTGLGLALTHQIVQEHAGSITVDSEVGQGTVFRVSLPLAREGPVAAAATTGTLGSTMAATVAAREARARDRTT